MVVASGNRLQRLDARNPRVVRIVGPVVLGAPVVLERSKKTPMFVQSTKAWRVVMPEFNVSREDDAGRGCRRICGRSSSCD